MSDPLRVLVLEGERGDADAVRSELVRAGHSLLRCHEPGAPAFPCNALAAGQHCPLDEGVVDIAVDVRSRSRVQPSPEEDGIACALRRHIPVIVAGPKWLNPYDAYAAEVVSTESDVVAACERVAGAPLREHTEVAARALRLTLNRRGIRCTPLVAVHRRQGRLAVGVSGAAHLDTATKSMASVRMSAALRDLDRDARGIEVAFHAR